MLQSPWTILTSFIAYAAWHALRIARSILSQERHEPLPRRKFIESDWDLEVEACKIAEANVRACMEKRSVLGGGTAHILCAGQRNFREPWARDFSFATFGLLALGEHETVREGLEVFFRFQRPDGQMPVKVHSTDVMERYLHSLFGRKQPIKAPLKPKYITGHRTISLDGNGLMVIAAAHYYLKTEDGEFLNQVNSALTRALDWMGTFARADGLLHQGPFTDWADTVARRGVVLYTNVVYWRALYLVATLRGSAELHGRAELVRQAIQDVLWMPQDGYFATCPNMPILNSDGNSLAVAWGMVEGEQAQRILDAMESRGMAGPVPTRCTDKPYPRGLVGFENFLAGIPNYHMSAAWMWLGSWHAVALLQAGRRERALELLHAMDRHVVQDGIVYEVYGTDGHPLSTVWYGSEAPLTWNAAMLLYAHKKVAGHVH